MNIFQRFIACIVISAFLITPSYTNAQSLNDQLSIIGSQLEAILNMITQSNLSPTELAPILVSVRALTSQLTSINSRGVIDYSGSPISVNGQQFPPDLFSTPDTRMLTGYDSLILDNTLAPKTAVDRTVVEGVKITGSVPTLESQLEITFGDETVSATNYTTETFVYDLNFSAKATSSTIEDRALSLRDQSLKAVADLHGLSPEYLYEIATTSIELFASATDVESQYKKATELGQGMSDYMGILSVIDSVNVVAGLHGLTITATSDQNEIFFARLGNEKYTIAGSEGSIGYKPNSYESSALYSIHNVVTESGSENGYTKAGLQDFFELDLEGLAEHLGTYGTTSDDVAVAEMLDFMISNPAYYWKRSYDPTLSCWDERTRLIVVDILEFAFDLQFADSLENIVTLSNPALTYTGDNGPNACKDVQSFFPTLP